MKWSQTGNFDNPNDVILLAEGDNDLKAFNIEAKFTVPESRYGAHPIQITRYGSEDVYSPKGVRRYSQTGAFGPYFT